MANNNPPRNARSATSRPSRSGGGRSAFYAVLIAIAVIGVGAIVYFMKSPPASANSAQTNAEYAALQRNYANAGPPQPYTLGNPQAPVVIEEFADFECPSCGRFATITEPDVRKRIVETGQAYYKYYDFPLPMHKNTQAASSAAACASDQGKFWEMHDQLFAGQDAWGLGAGDVEMVDNPKQIFTGYARALGLNMPQWEQCYDTRKNQPRINANTAEAFRRNVEQTPTFYVNGKMSAGSISYDELKKMVDAATAAGSAKAAPAKPAPAN